MSKQIMNECLGMNITCAAYHCDVLLDDTLITSMITDAMVRKKYQQAVCKDFVNVCIQIFNAVLLITPLYLMSFYDYLFGIGQSLVKMVSSTQLYKPD